MIGKLLSGFFKHQREDEKLQLHRKLIRHEAELGGQLFGKIPKGHRREFFCLDEHTWVWHEETTNSDGQRQISTTRYDIRPTGILKAQNGQGYHSVSLAEAENLLAAMKLYHDKVLMQLYPA